jgi:hypothetical protein
MKKLNKNNLIILLIFVISVFLIFFKLNKQQTDNNIPAASPEPSQAAFDCTVETIKLYQQNDRRISVKQDNGGRLIWKNEKYNWMVFNCPSDDDTLPRVFLLTKVDEKDQEKIIFSMEDEVFDFVKIRDINKDGTPELIIQHGNLGNCWNCHGQSVFQIVNGEVKDMFPDLPKVEGYKYANVWVSESNNGKTDDIMVVDDSWEGGHGWFCHANAPSHVITLTWKDGKYQRDGLASSSYYLKNISGRHILRKKIFKDKDNTPEQIISLAIEDFWDYQEIEKNDEGYAKFILNTSPETIPSNFITSDEDKKMIEEVRAEIQKEYKDYQ